MTRPLVTLALVVVMTLAQPAPAAAGFWAWLEEWSGPGPFRGFTFLFTACIQDKQVKPSPIALNDQFHKERIENAQVLANRLKQPESVLLKRVLANPAPVVEAKLNLAALNPDSALLTDAILDQAGRLGFNPRIYDLEQADRGPGHDDPRLICGYFDQGFFRAAADPTRGFPRLGAHLTDIGPSARLHDGIDIGGGFGWVAFSGDEIETKRRLTLTPLRIILRPILLAVPEHHRKPWMGFLNFYWKETYVVGRLTGADFGAPNDALSVNGELVRSFGLNLDVTALFPAKWNLR